MTKQKSSTKKVSSASQRTQNAWKTRKAKQVEVATELLNEKSENLRLKSEIERLRIEKGRGAAELKNAIKNLKDDKERIIRQFDEKIMFLQDEINEYTNFLATETKILS